MIAIYCAVRDLERRLERSVPEEREPFTVRAWDEFESTAPRADCSVVLITWLPGASETESLATFKRHHPQHPVVLVTRGDMTNARALAGMTVEDVVWLQDVERDLPAAVGRTCVLSQSRTLADALSQGRHLPPRLRQALLLAISAPRPVRTVSGLAAAVGCDRRTLWHHWNAACPGPLRVQDFLHWVLLMRALGGKTRDRSWASVAEEVGMHPDSLGRLARQLTGLGLRDLDTGRQATVADLFRTRVLGQVLAGEPDKLMFIGQNAVERERGNGKIGGRSQRVHARQSVTTKPAGKSDDLAS
ncbi:MAG TPA: hypothetical protein VGB24_01595 [Longimicrobium sp.]|jgi:hypothetical protein|uniref:hypothetical protein n=1 Tax=Longimicrobium sp. TaxID=2029185 RepID=UPI002EDB0A6E